MALELSDEERRVPVRHYIDPGFVNHRLVETIVGETGTTAINEGIARLSNEADWLKRLRTDHIYTRVALAFCEALAVPSLGQVLAAGRGRIFCSTERVVPIKGGVSGDRGRVRIRTGRNVEYDVQLAFSVNHIVSDTLRAELVKGADLSIIAARPIRDGSILTFEPLIIGSPWLETDDPKWKDIAPWWGRTYYEVRPEEFDEFSRMALVQVPSANDRITMKGISEKAFKICLAEILGETVSNDWGGETSDHFTAHVNLDGRRLSAAFLLKGPARYSPMTLNHLGKNNDQICRLANEPADILIVQHCHEITPPVRATLRAFAVQPNNPRRYCLMDGRDSLRLLQAYGKLERAISLSSEALRE